MGQAHVQRCRDLVKKIYVKITDELDLVFVEKNQQTFTFLSGSVTGRNRFIPARSPINGDYMVVIEDYVWWAQNQQAIMAWMTKQLPRGTDHQQGMIITFDSEQDRTWFLLKWA